VKRALMVGQLAINLPILCGFILFEFAFGPKWSGVTFLTAGTLAYFWWAILTPRWRSWALRSGVDGVALYHWGLWTGLLVPKGSILEKAEIYLSDRAFFGLLSALLLLVFFSTETLLSEFLESRISGTGFIGSLLAAGISAVLVFPVHQALQRFLKRADAGQVDTSLSPPSSSPEGKEPRSEA